MHIFTKHRAVHLKLSAHSFVLAAHMYVYLGMHGFMIARLWCARERKAAQNRQSDRQKGREGERKRR